jgi:hypothetical protein
MERCWGKPPSVRPRITEILAFFEAASRGWTCPTSEAIASLGLDQATSPNSSTMEPTFTMSGTTFGTVGGYPASPGEAGPPPPSLGGMEGTVAVLDQPLL